MSARVVAARRLWCGRRQWRDGRLFGSFAKRPLLWRARAGRDDGSGRIALCACAGGRTGSHEAPQADSYCYRATPRGVCCRPSLALPHGPRPLPLLVVCVAAKAYGTASDSTALMQAKRVKTGPIALAVCKTLASRTVYAYAAGQPHSCARSTAWTARPPPTSGSGGRRRNRPIRASMAADQQVPGTNSYWDNEAHAA